MSFTGRSSSFGVEDAASQSSSTKSGRSSLLERIQAQRNREQQQQVASSVATPQQIHVPQYNPEPSADLTNLTGSTTNIFSSAWSNLSESMEQGMAAFGPSADIDMDARETLLAPPNHSIPQNPGEYSMRSYFFTFVADVYGLFQSLPVLVRWMVCAVLLYIAIRLL